MITQPVNISEQELEAACQLYDFIARLRPELERRKKQRLLKTPDKHAENADVPTDPISTSQQ